VQRHGEQVVGQIRDAIKRIDVEHRRLRQSIDDASAWVERTLGPALDSSVVERLSPTSGISGTEER
jgi:phage gp36-like protein